MHEVLSEMADVIGAILWRGWLRRAEEGGREAISKRNDSHPAPKGQAKTDLAKQGGHESEQSRKMS